MRICQPPIVALLLLAVGSSAYGTVISGISVNTTPSGTTMGAASVTSTGSQVDNNPGFTGPLASNPNQLNLSFSYDNTYLASPSKLEWFGSTRDTINDGGAKFFTFNVSVTNNSSVALQELSFTLSGPPATGTFPGGPILFDTSTVAPTSPLDSFAGTTQFLKFGFLGGSTSLAPGGTGDFSFLIDVPDSSDGTFVLSAEVTPEPASIGLAILACGLGFVGLRRRYRKAAGSGQAL